MESANKVKVFLSFLSSAFSLLFLLLHHHHLPPRIRAAGAASVATDRDARLSAEDATDPLRVRCVCHVK